MCKYIKLTLKFILVLEAIDIKFHREKEGYEIE